MRCFLAVKLQVFKNFNLEQEIGGVAGASLDFYFCPRRGGSVKDGG
jgi:hypothetical protein